MAEVLVEIINRELRTEVVVVEITFLLPKIVLQALGEEVEAELRILTRASSMNSREPSPLM